MLERYVTASRGGHALVVEDEARDPRTGAAHARGGGLAGQRGGERQGGARRLADSPPSLILLDLMMPVMDGFQFMERLPEVNDARNIPVFVLTAKILTEQEKRFLEKRSEFIAAKNNGYLDGLLAKIRTTLPDSASQT